MSKAPARIAGKLGAALMLAACTLSTTPSVAATLSYGLGVTDFDAPTSFSFGFNTPIVSLFGMVNYTVTISAVLTDAGRDGVFMSPLAPQPSIFGFSLDGDEFFTDPLGSVFASFGPLVYTGSYDCGAGGCSSLQARVNFNASGGDDLYAITGGIEVLEASRVPEPAGLGLLALAALGWAAAGRGRLRGRLRG